MGRQVNFNIGIIGCGLVGYKRSRSLGLKGRLVACADININRAKKLASNKKIKIFIQVNIGEEEQKNGVFPNKLESFYKICSQDLGLNIIGLMCLPPINKNVESYFAKMLNLRNTVTYVSFLST